MDASFHLTIMTPETTLFDGRVISLIAPCALGYLGVLAHHAPLIASVVRGNIVIRKDSQEEKLIHAEGEGFLEVLENNVMVILKDGAR